MYDDYSDETNVSQITISECALQDKKRTSTEADANSISANNSNEDCITSGMKKQSRINEAMKTFNLLFGRVPAKHFSYLMTFTTGYGVTYSFDVTDQIQREAMARKAVELSELGNDVWHAVNPVCVSPTGGKRGDETAVSYQTAVVVDIDICSDAHKSDNLAANFEEAKSFLPFAPSIIINSGYGLHAYYIWTEAIAVTDDNREEIKRRNNLLLDVVRQRAKGKKIDGVGDLPRILRTPGTFNYKLGKDNAPLCCVVEVNDVRFTPEHFDEKLDALYVEKKLEPKLTHSIDFDFADDSSDLKEFRIRRMLDFISVFDGEYEKWLSVGMALKNEDLACSLWEDWSRTQPEFKEGECESKWQGFNRPGYGIGTLYQYAVEGGYDEIETRREWKELHPEFDTSEKKKSSSMDKLKEELRSVTKDLAEFDTEKNKALERLSGVETFDNEAIFSEDVVTAAAFARLFDSKAFSDFKGSITLFNQKTKEKKTSVNDWLRAVKEKANKIDARHKELLARKNEIQTQISALSFVTEHDLLKGFSFPAGYNVSAQSGISKIDGEKIITVCRRPIVITEKTYNIEDKILKLKLAHMNTTGKWKSLPAQSAAIIFNSRKIVDLAEQGLPVTSSNATALVDFLDAFNVQNEIVFPMTYSVSRGGWYTFDDTDYFVDPRCELSVTKDDKKIRVKIDSQSQFVQALKKHGSLKAWKRAYKLAKKSPVARIIVAAAVAPILLKILGERNFLLYIYAPTRAGKTTALYLGASAVGSEKIIRSFDATKNGLAGAAADVNDYPFLIDEKQVVDNKIKEQLDSLVYALANGIGRTKLNKDSTLRKTTDWRTIPIMTGETLLLPDNVTGGANTRLLTVAAPCVILDADTCKQIRDIIADNFGLAFPLVINKIFSMGKKMLRESYSKIVEFFADEYPNVLDEYRRYMAVLTLADALLNVVLSEECEDMREDFSVLLEDAKILAREIFKLIPTTAEISDTVREKEFVLSFIAQNQNSFIGGNVPLERILAIKGKFDRFYTYITVAALKKACAEEGFDYRKLVSDLVADGFFVPSDTVEKGYKNPRPTVKVWLGKGATNCYRFRTNSEQEIKRPPEEPPEKSIKEESTQKEESIQDIVDETFGFTTESQQKSTYKGFLDKEPRGKPPD